MKITAIKTDLVHAKQFSVEELLDKYVSSLSENSVIAISSKIVSLCEGNVKKVGSVDEDALWHQESDYYLPADTNRYGHHFSLKGSTLVGRAGIDKSNGYGHFVLWPRDPQASANNIRQYLMNKFGRQNVGVIITDSISIPMRLGAVGTAIAYSGFKPLKNYVGQPDLFGREFAVERANLAEGLAAAAVLAMGEGSEQTPLAIVEDLPQIEFCQNDPGEEELKDYHLNFETDVFEVFYKNAPWQKGGS